MEGELLRAKLNNLVAEFLSPTKVDLAVLVELHICLYVDTYVVYVYICICFLGIYPKSLKHVLDALATPKG